MTNSKLDEYIKSFINGNKDDFNIIYEETKKGVFLSIWNIIKRRDIIEELMQDTYQKALNNLKSYKCGTNFKAWINTLARNNALNYYNKENRIILDDTKTDIIEATSSPLITSCLEILSGVQKDIFIYKIILNHTFKEIANLLNMKTSTVFFCYKETLKYLKEKLKETI